MRLIETDKFPIEFLSKLAERESWRKEIHRPIYHVHKWWAQRLGSVFRGVLLGCVLSEDNHLTEAFYSCNSFSGIIVLDPFMGSGTIVGEAHKLGFTVLGRDINPVAVTGVKTALGPMSRTKLEDVFKELSQGVGERIMALYRSTDSHGRPADVLYYFWVMQVCCPECRRQVDLFSSFVIAANAYPKRKPEVQVLCPVCGDIFPALYGQQQVVCRSCKHMFNPIRGNAARAEASCYHCGQRFPILDALDHNRPNFRLYGKLVLTPDGTKEYLPVSQEDRVAYKDCTELLKEEVRSGKIQLPTLELRDGHNTRQAMRYGFRSWRDFFNDRQLLALGWLHAEIAKISDAATRQAFLTLFSGILEFNNMFASYKGEGTGAVRHMFAHHILKPERTPIEANVWGTPKSSGSFFTLFRSRLLRALEYRLHPKEINLTKGSIVCSLPFSGKIEQWPTERPTSPRAIYLSRGDSAETGLPDHSVDLVVTDPPFFDNVHYSELADFFYAWQQIDHGETRQTTRNSGEVQDVNPQDFAMKLRAVFQECHRVLRDEGLLVFTYHHSREEGWQALADAVLGAGFTVVNSQPVKAEMSGATPKTNTKEPIQLDIVVVCRKAKEVGPQTIENALTSARAKLRRLEAAGLRLSRNDRKVVLYGQLLTTVSSPAHMVTISRVIEQELVEMMDFEAGKTETTRLDR